MNESYLNVLEAHKGRIEHFISRYEMLFSENMRLKEDIGNLQQELERYKEEKTNNINKIKELEQKIDKMQLTEAFASSAADVREAKQNINRMVREIEKCIALLND